MGLSWISSSASPTSDSWRRRSRGFPENISRNYFFAENQRDKYYLSAGALGRDFFRTGNTEVLRVVDDVDSLVAVKRRSLIAIISVAVAVSAQRTSRGPPTRLIQRRIPIARHT